MSRRKHKRLGKEVELDITAFMNLMIVLVPVLLLSMVFAQTSVIDLNFPAIDDSQPPLTKDTFQLQVIIRDQGLRVADSKRGLISSIDLVNGKYNFEALSSILKQLKARFPDKTDVSILLDENVDYQTLVTVMDVTRSYATVVAMNEVEAELFPDISIGDAPLLTPVWPAKVSQSLSGEQTSQLRPGE